MKKKVKIILLALTVCGGLTAMDWPSAGAGLVGNFGVNERGGPSLGATFAGNGVVHAAETGELLFVRQSSETASRLPSPLGTWAAIDHGDGLISVYSRLDGKKRLSPPKTIEKNMGIAEMGISGWSKEKGFHFSLFDRKERRWVNPAMIISRLDDRRPPSIQAVRLQSASNRSIDVSQLKNSISQGRYTVFVTIADLTAAGESTLAPFRIICAVNGREIGALTFETFSARDGRLLIYRNGLIPVREVYADYPAFEMGEAVFSRGQASLEVIAQDINENSQTAVYKISVD